MFHIVVEKYIEIEGYTTKLQTCIGLTSVNGQTCGAAVDHPFYTTSKNKFFLSLLYNSSSRL